MYSPWFTNAKGPINRPSFRHPKRRCNVLRNAFFVFYEYVSWQFYRRLIIENISRKINRETRVKVKAETETSVFRESEWWAASDTFVVVDEQWRTLTRAIWQATFSSRVHKYFASFSYVKKPLYEEINITSEWLRSSKSLSVVYVGICSDKGKRREHAT